MVDSLTSCFPFLALLEFAHLTGEDPWNSLHLCKLLWNICFSLDICYSWMKSEKNAGSWKSPCTIACNVALEEVCRTRLSHFYVEICRRSCLKLKKWNWQGEGWRWRLPIIRLTPIPSSCSATKRCDLGITACGITTGKTAQSARKIQRQEMSHFIENDPFSKLFRPLMLLVAGRRRAPRHHWQGGGEEDQELPHRATPSQFPESQTLQHPKHQTTQPSDLTSPPPKLVSSNPLLPRPPKLPSFTLPQLSHSQP